MQDLPVELNFPPFMLTVPALSLKIELSVVAIVPPDTSTVP